jgi:hypothetical protein
MTKSYVNISATPCNTDMLVVSRCQPEEISCDPRNPGQEKKRSQIRVSNMPAKRRLSSTKQETRYKAGKKASQVAQKNKRKRAQSGPSPNFIIFIIVARAKSHPRKSIGVRERSRSSKAKQSSASKASGKKCDPHSRERKIASKTNNRKSSQESQTTTIQKRRKA